MWLCMGLTYLLKIQVSDSIFIYHMHIMHIHYFCTYYAYHDFSFPVAGHSDRKVVFKSAAYYALSDEDLEEILSCDNEPVLRAYMIGLFRARPSLEVWHASRSQISVPDRRISSSNCF